MHSFIKQVRVWFFWIPRVPCGPLWFLILLSLRFLREISDFTFNSYLYLLIDYNLSIIPVLTLNHGSLITFIHGEWTMVSSLATWQSKETRLRLLRRGKKFHWSINHHFDTRTEISASGLVSLSFMKDVN